MNENFFIYKKSFSQDAKPDLSFIPMMTRRKLSPLVKTAFSTIYNCYEGGDIPLVFASQHGEFDILKKLISQYTEDNEVSPIAFSSSVHNSAIGTFSLLNKVNSKYTAVSAGKNSLSNGFMEAVTENSPTLFCFADTLPHPASVSCLIGKTPDIGADKILLTLDENEHNEDEFKAFVAFLNGETNIFKAPYYTLRRAYD